MKDTWDVTYFVPYVRSRWRIPVISCATALILTLAISLLLPKRYTANVVIRIDPPPGGDARMTATVNPVYLESLKGYERLVASDKAFARAADNFHLRTANFHEPIETLKKRVLIVSKIRDTRLLEISATLPNPQLAHQVANYVAEDAVRVSQEDSMAADRDAANKIDHKLAEARGRLEQTLNNPTSDSLTATIEAIESRNDTDQDLLARVRHELTDLKADAAGFASNQASIEGGAARDQVNTTRARAGVLKEELTELEHEIAVNESRIRSTISRREEAEARSSLARSEYERIANRALDTQLPAGSGERLRIIDPGIIPERPSSPNLFLNLMIAMAFALTGSICFCALAFSYERRRVQDALFQ